MRYVFFLSLFFVFVSCTTTPKNKPTKTQEPTVQSEPKPSPEPRVLEEALYKDGSVRVRYTLPAGWQRGRSPLKGQIDLPSMLLGDPKTGATVLAMFMPPADQTPEEFAAELRSRMETHGVAAKPIEKKIIRGRPTAWFDFEAEKESGVRTNGRVTVIRYLGTPGIMGAFSAEWPFGDDESETKAKALVDSFEPVLGPQPTASDRPQQEMH